ncbi:hypothetical protein ACED96_08110 [Clostridium thermobutyricum]
MNTAISNIIFAALIIYFAFSLKRTFDRKKDIYSQGECNEFSYYPISFFVYIAIDIILFILLIFKYKNLDMIEIILGFIFILIMAISTFLNTKVILSPKGLFFNYYFVQYKTVSKLDIISIKNKYRINFLKTDKIIFSLKINKTQKDMIKKFISAHSNLEISEK